MKLTEDDLYRHSSQYRNWSFTPAQLTLQREKTNAQAIERIKAAYARRAKALDVASASESERANTPGLDNGNGAVTGSNTPVRVAEKEREYMTVAEEKQLVDKFCETAMKLGNFLKQKPDVTATAIQFVRRFYLYNSVMTYDGTDISKAAMFLTLKIENGTKAGTVDDYAAKIPKTTSERVRAPEFTIVQALRFNFDVRHPFRGLKGAQLELADMVKGTYVPLQHDERSAEELQVQMLQMLGGTEEAAERRLGNVYRHAKDILSMGAQMTDAYFLYTPSQIMLAAHLLADAPLTTLYLSTKIPPTSPVSAKLFATLRACADLLSSHRSFTPMPLPPNEAYAWADTDPAAMKPLIAKLKLCRDPDKRDLVKLSQAQKRDAVRDGELEESKAKKRKLNREKAEKEADAFWGPELPKAS
ncbi:hypothetical protein N0V90_001744 [Kalmusia sp. IMI 367209]|nr:hypothetical protein N0V90_001744 [Kalmusia sp. IMI 367209]